MKKGLTEVIFVIDRSGSMAGKEKDVTGGFKKFLEEQKKLPGDLRITLVEFDNVITTVYVNKPAEEIVELEYQPRGTTALLDAVGKTIESVGLRYKTTLENERPEHVIFIVNTDGYENSSRVFSKEQIQGMTKHQTDKYNWKFMYFGANQDAFAEASTIGMKNQWTLSYDNTSKGIATSYNIADSNVRAIRGNIVNE